MAITRSAHPLTMIMCFALLLSLLPLCHSSNSSSKEKNAAITARAWHWAKNGNSLECFLYSSSSKPLSYNSYTFVYCAAPSMLKIFWRGTNIIRLYKTYMIKLIQTVVRGPHPYSENPESMHMRSYMRAHMCLKSAYIFIYSIYIRWQYRYTTFGLLYDYESCMTRILNNFSGAWAYNIAVGFV